MQIASNKAGDNTLHLDLRLEHTCVSAPDDKRRLLLGVHEAHEVAPLQLEAHASQHEVRRQDRLFLALRSPDASRPFHGNNCQVQNEHTWIFTRGSLEISSCGENSPLFSSSLGTLKPDSNAKYLPDSSSLSMAESTGTETPASRIFVSIRGNAKYALRR